MPSGRNSSGLHTMPACRTPVVVGAVEHEHRPVDADLAGGEADAVRGVHRGDHVRDQRAQGVVELGDRLLGAVHHRLAPPGDRADRAPGGQGSLDGVGLRSGHAGRVADAATVRSPRGGAAAA